jgi:hypothetical protein
MNTTYRYIVFNIERMDRYKKQKLIEKFEKISNETDTTISSHLPKILKSSLKQLSKIKDSALIVHLGLQQGSIFNIFNKISAKCPLIQIGVDTTFSDEYKLYQKSDHRIYKMDILKYSQIHERECQKNRIKSKIDILVLCCSHLYEPTLKELQSYIPFLSHQGLVILHNTHMCPLRFDDGQLGWKLKNGQIKKGGWDNQRGVSRALETYFQITMHEDKKFKIYFDKWSLTHDPICNGLTILKMDKSRHSYTNPSICYIHKSHNLSQAQPQAQPQPQAQAQAQEQPQLIDHNYYVEKYDLPIYDVNAIINHCRENPQNQRYDPKFDLELFRKINDNQNLTYNDYFNRNYIFDPIKYVELCGSSN